MTNPPLSEKTLRDEFANLLCWLFGHPAMRRHYHKQTDRFWCRGECEKYEIVYEVLPCERCERQKFTNPTGEKE